MNKELAIIDFELIGEDDEGFYSYYIDAVLGVPADCEGRVYGVDTYFRDTCYTVPADLIERVHPNVLKLTKVPLEPWRNRVPTFFMEQK